MGYGGTDNQQQHAQRAAGHNAQVAVTSISDRQGEYAQWNNKYQHLIVQVRLCVLGEKRHTQHDEWQSQTMQKAKRRQRYCRAVEPIARFLCILSNCVS